VSCHLPHRLPSSDLENGRGFFPDISFGMMIATVEQVLALLVS